MQKQRSSKNASNSREEAEEEEEEQAPSVFENDIDRQLMNLTPLISELILTNLAKLTDDDVSYFQFIRQLRKNLKRFGKLCLDLTLCNNLDIRVANRALLQRIFDDMQARLD